MLPMRPEHPPQKLTHLTGPLVERLRFLQPNSSPHILAWQLVNMRGSMALDTRRAGMRSLHTPLLQAVLQSRPEAVIAELGNIAASTKLGTILGTRTQVAHFFSRLLLGSTTDTFREKHCGSVWSATRMFVCFLTAQI